MESDQWLLTDLSNHHDRPEDAPVKSHTAGWTLCHSILGSGNQPSNISPGFKAPRHGQGSVKIWQKEQCPMNAIILLWKSWMSKTQVQRAAQSQSSICLLTPSTDSLITGQAKPYLQVLRSALHQLGNAKPSTPFLQYDQEEPCILLMLINCARVSLYRYWKKRKKNQKKKLSHLKQQTRHRVTPLAMPKSSW